MKAIKILVKGKVQGVHFRASTITQAKILNISGTVQNTIEGDVLIYAEGEENNLEKFQAWCYSGPMMARVSSVVSEDIPIIGFATFEIFRA